MCSDVILQNWKPLVWNGSHPYSWSATFLQNFAQTLINTPEPAYQGVYYYLKIKGRLCWNWALQEGSSLGAWLVTPAPVYLVFLPSISLSKTTSNTTTSKILLLLRLNLFKHNFNHVILFLIFRNYIYLYLSVIHYLPFPGDMHR